MTQWETETVELLRDEAATIPSWTPKRGVETNGLLSRMTRLDAAAKERVVTESARILSRCVEPGRPDRYNTGLVIGHVQSGKTLSFTTTAAMAADNGYRLIILIAGVSRPLLAQSNRRLERDLDYHNRNDYRWRIISNPGAREVNELRTIIRTWKDDRRQEREKRVVLLTVMKNVTRLRHLTRALEAVKAELHGTPALIIDDEADQASLNARARKGAGEQSPTYANILELRRQLPCHSYLQYTATPQAPLLINLIDTLSPDFAELLTAGRGYSGGQVFFQDHFDMLVHEIPEADIPREGVLPPDTPESLLRALRTFFLGVAAARANSSQGLTNRSMIIHPSMETDPHAEYMRRVETIVRSWSTVLDSSPSDHDRFDLVAEFRTDYATLKSSVEKLGQSIPTFEQLIEQLPLSLSDTRIVEMNSALGPTPDIDWQAAPFHLLVGGQAMNRGFTVEGLTVTYMPRGIGVGNLDTVQQRARFFGYKSSYLGYCHIFLDRPSIEFYRAYVEHELDVRRSLEAHRGRPLNEWPRAFFNPGGHRLTRTEVLVDPAIHVDPSDRWFRPAFPHETDAALEDNRTRLREFEDKIEDRLQRGEGDDRSHIIARDLPLRTVLDELLVPFRYTYPRDWQRFFVVRLALARHLESNPEAVCDIYFMGLATKGSRERSLKGDKDDTNYRSRAINNLHQGRSDNGGGTPDNRTRREGVITLHCFKLDLLTAPRHNGGDVIPGLSNVPAIAVYIPQSASSAYTVQVSDEEDDGSDDE